MSEETLDSIYSRYGIPGTGLLRENYPFDSGYKAGYLAGMTVYKVIPIPICGPSPAHCRLCRQSMRQHRTRNGFRCLMKGLCRSEMYADEKRIPPAYASYVNTAAQSDRFYDDNIWLGIDFVDLYNSTKDAIWLHRAQKIWSS